MEPKIIQLIAPSHDTWVDYCLAPTPPTPMEINRKRVEAFGLRDDGLVVPLVADNGTIIPSYDWEQSNGVQVLGINCLPEDEWLRRTPRIEQLMDAKMDREPSGSVIRGDRPLRKATVI
jgi:hypothetical protein